MIQNKKKCHIPYVETAIFQPSELKIVIASCAGKDQNIKTLKRVLEISN